MKFLNYSNYFTNRLHHPLPQTLEEGEEFGKNWSIEDFCRCIPLKWDSFLLNRFSRWEEELNAVFFYRPDTSRNESYENIDQLQKDMELNTFGSTIMQPDGITETERTPLDARHRRHSMRHLVRQASTVNTQRTTEGTMKLTYWF